MINYKDLYHFLFNGITDVIQEMELPESKGDTEKFINYLKLLQNGAEEQFLKMGDDE